MRITIADDDFLDECYGLNIDFQNQELPDELFFYVSNSKIETPPEYLSNENNIDYSLLEESDNFMDVDYHFEIYSSLTGSKYIVSLSNRDFWYNLHSNKSVIKVNDSGIIVETFSEVVMDATIKDFFLYHLSEEIERIDKLEPFNSFREFYVLHQEFCKNFNEIWCDEIRNFHEAITVKMHEKKDLCLKDIEFKIAAEIIYIKRLDTEINHLKRIKEIISPLSIAEGKKLLLSFKKIVEFDDIKGGKIIDFYKFHTDTQLYKIVSSITYFHLEKLIDLIVNKNYKEIFSSPLINFTVKPHSFKRKIPLDQKVFKTALLELVNTTSEENKKFTDAEIEYICLFLADHRVYNSNRPESDKFNKWLGNDLNRLLFKTFLNFASASSSNIIKNRTYDALADSISKKFQIKGFSKKTLLNYLNAKEPDFKLTNPNKSSFAYIKDHIIRTEKNLQNGTLKKMYKEILKKL